MLVQNKLQNLKKVVWCIKKKKSMLTVGSFPNPYWQEVAPFQITLWQNGAKGDRSFSLRIMQNMSYRWHWQWWWSDCIYHPIHHTSLRLEPQPEKETCKPKEKCPAVLGYFLLILWGSIPKEDFDDNCLWLVLLAKRSVKHGNKGEVSGGLWERLCGNEGKMSGELDMIYSICVQNDCHS